jgi:Flp pilus assembly protein TadB
MLEISVLILLLYTSLLFFAYTSKNALKPMSDFLEATLSEGAISSHCVNSYSKRIKKRSITSVEQLNNMLLGRLEELRKLNKKTAEGNRRSYLLPLIILYAVAFLTFFAIVVDFYATVFLILLIVLVLVGLYMAFRIINRVSENEIMVIADYLERVKAPRVN